MAPEVIIRTVFEAAAVLLFIIALLNEKKLIAFEHRIAVRWRTYRTARNSAVRAEDVYCAQETVRDSERTAAGTPPQRRPRRTSRSRKPAA
ncbi:MAG: hypothetical protein ACLU8W_12165 [Clostridia bacterium]